VIRSTARIAQCIFGFVRIVRVGSLLIPRIVRIGRYFGIVMIRADPIDAIDPTDRPRSCRAAQLPQHTQFCKIIFFRRIRSGSPGFAKSDLDHPVLQNQIRITRFCKIRSGSHNLQNYIFPQDHFEDHKNLRITASLADHKHRGSRRRSRIAHPPGLSHYVKLTPHTADKPHNEKVRQ
jgi:hypothetical protein